MATNMFSYFEKLGFDNSIIFQSKSEKGEIKNVSLSHEHYDGVSGLISLLKTHTQDNLKVEASSERPIDSLSWFKKINILATYLKKDIFPQKRKFYLHKKIDFDRENVNFLYFTELEQIKIKKIAKAHRCNFNTYFIKKLATLVSPYLDQEKSPSLWMIPVSMYPKITPKITSGNQTSFIELDILETDSFQSLDKKIKKIIANKEYIAPLMMQKLLLRLPIWMALIIIKLHLKKNLRIGTFSNLGQWNIANDSDKMSWGFSAPLTPSQPISFSLLTLNNRLCLSFRSYSSLNIDFSEDIIRNLLLTE